MQQLTLFDQTPDEELSWPEQLVRDLGGQMTTLDTPNGRRYCVRDWVHVVSASKSKNRNNAFDKLQRAMRKINDWRFYPVRRERLENPDAQDKEMDFTDDIGLYEITTRMDSKSEPVRIVKTMLAKSAAFVDWARLHPELAAAGFLDIAKQKQLPPTRQSKDYRRALDSGYSQDEAEQWVDLDRKAKEIRKDYAAVVIDRGGNIAHVTNFVTRVATGLRATDWKQEWKIKASPRQYMSLYKKAAISVIEFLAPLYHRQRDSQGDAQLVNDILDVSKVINWEELQRQEDRDLKLPAPKAEQKRLGDGR